MPHASENLERFELVLNTISMDEAVGQAERKDSPSAAEAAAQAELAKDDSGSTSDQVRSGRLG